MQGLWINGKSRENADRKKTKYLNDRRCCLTCFVDNQREYMVRWCDRRVVTKKFLVRLLWNHHRKTTVVIQYARTQPTSTKHRQGSKALSKRGKEWRGGDCQRWDAIYKEENHVDIRVKWRIGAKASTIIRMVYRQVITGSRQNAYRLKEEESGERERERPKQKQFREECFAKSVHNRTHTQVFRRRQHASKSLTNKYEKTGCAPQKRRESVRERKTGSMQPK